MEKVGYRECLTCPMSLSMHLEVLVEDASTGAALEVLVPRVTSSVCTHRIQEFRGKQDMLKRLQGRFRGYAKWDFDHSVVVIIDQDRDDCSLAKSKIEKIARNCGLLLPNSPKNPKRLAIRIAMTELEAWFLGDPSAIHKAFPKIREKNIKIKGAVDEVPNPAKQLERLLQRHSYYRTGMPKVQVARLIAEHMDPYGNQSPSFQLLIRTLSELGS